MRANFYTKKGATFRYPLKLPTLVVPLFQLFIGHCCCLVKKPLLRIVAVNHDRCNVEIVEPKRSFALKFHSLVNKPIENLINASSVNLVELAICASVVMLASASTQLFVYLPEIVMVMSPLLALVKVYVLGLLVSLSPFGSDMLNKFVGRGCVLQPLSLLFLPKLWHLAAYNFH